MNNDLIKMFIQRIWKERTQEMRDYELKRGG